MAPWGGRFRFPLYLRLWLAVVLAVVLLTLAFGYLWRATAQQAPAREVIIRDQAGDIVGRVNQRAAWVPGQGLEFQVAMNDGTTLIVQLPPRQRRAGEGPSTRPWVRASDTLFWILGITALAVAIGAYPIVRRLTQRLDGLRRGVERWGEGDLSVRVDEHGSDELAFVAQRFNHAAERLQALLTSHRSLLANASHELRSPLARIRMGVELLGPEASPAFQEEIRRNIAELDQLIDEILLASRLDARETDIGSFEAVDLTGLAAEECAHADAELLPPQDGQPLVVQGVAKLLRRAVRNLLENARRYSHGPVRVELAREGELVALRVRDRGPGVPPAERERIFEPFYRLPGASEQHGGVGLGLSLVRSIAQRHRGSAACVDQEGGGACFVLRLPARER